MARIRSVKPEFWKSETIAALSMQTRLTFIALWTYVDDNGVGRDVEKLVAAELYPLEDDPRETLAHVSRSLAELSDHGRIVRYTVEGKPFLAVVNWTEHQKIDKPNKPRYPGPEEADKPLTCDSRQPRESVESVSRTSRETPAPGAVEQGISGTGDQGKGLASAKPPRKPDEIWDALLEACHVEPSSVTASSRGAYNKAVADLKAVDATPEEIRRRAAIFRGQWRDVSLTPTALARRWAECERPFIASAPQTQTARQLDAAMIRAQEAEAQHARKALP